MWLKNGHSSNIYCFFNSEFAEASHEVSEPEDSATTSISLVVERTGGATGVVEVFWNVSASSGKLHVSS